MTLLRSWILVVAIVLIEVAFTALGPPPRLLVFALLAASAVAATIVVLEFMRLRYERGGWKWALAPLVIACILLLGATLPDSFRLARMRTPERQGAHANPLP